MSEFTHDRPRVSAAVAVLVGASLMSAAAAALSARQGGAHRVHSGHATVAAMAGDFDYKAQSHREFPDG
jgi:hypothetical protein